MFDTSENKIVINNENVNLIKKYGFEISIYLNYIKNNGYDVTKNNGEVVDSYDCTDEELYDYLRSRPKLYERLSSQISVDTIVVPCNMLDNDLLKLLINENSKKIVIQGLIENSLDSNLLEKLCSKENVYFNFGNLIDATLFQFINRPNCSNKSNEESLRVYFADSMNNLDMIFSSIIKYIGNNGIKEVYFTFIVDNPKFITESMPYIINKLRLMNVKCNIEYKLTKSAEKTMSKDYSYYKAKEKIEDSSERVTSSENMSFSSIDDYIEFMNILDVIETRLPKNACELDKIVYISTFIINYITYVDNGSMSDVNSTLLRGYGVCQDYSYLTKYLLNKFGVKCELAHGRSKNPNGDGHAWNVVYIDNIPYYLDNTWVKDSRCLFLSDFLCSSEDFKRTHGEFIYSDHNCPFTYPRHEIEASMNRVLEYQNNYVISKDQLLKLISQTKYYEVDKALKGEKVSRSI